MTVPGQVGHASWINTDDLEWAYGGHYGTQGQIDLGIRFANQLATIPVPEPGSLSLLVVFGLLLTAPACWHYRGLLRMPRKCRHFAAYRSGLYRLPSKGQRNVISTPHQPGLPAPNCRRTMVIVNRATMLIAALFAMGIPLDARSDPPSVSSPPAVAAPRLQLARGEDGKVTLAFTPLKGATTYAVRVVDAHGKPEVIENVEVADFTVHGLTNDREYRFAVRGLFDGRAGPWSNELSTRPAAQPGWDTLREAFTSGNPTRNTNPFVMIHGMSRRPNCGQFCGRPTMVDSRE